jgi:hypothetical protein
MNQSLKQSSSETGIRVLNKMMDFGGTGSDGLTVSKLLIDMSCSF